MFKSMRVAFGVFALLFVQCSNAGFDEGITAYNKMDYATALKAFKELAGQGYAEAQYNLGVMFEKGQGVSKDEAQALQWFRKAAEQGDEDAQFHIGLLFNKGKGIKKDCVQAAQWYRKAADQGNLNAQYNLAVLYEEGDGVKRSYVFAERWYEKACEQGHKGAREGAKRVSLKSQEEAISDRKLFNEGMVHFQNKYYKDAFKDFMLLAEREDSRSQYYVGWMYLNGQGVEKNFEQAVSWYRRSAAQEDVYAKSDLNDLFTQGLLKKTEIEIQAEADKNQKLIEAVAATIKKKDKFEATLKKLGPLAKRGGSKAQLQLGDAYYSASFELSEPKYCKEAFDWVRKSADQGYGYAMYELGEMYQNEEVDCPKDANLSNYWYGKAVSHFTKFANLGKVDAMSYLGQMYWREGGGMNDRDKAIYWFSKAANLGNASAQTSLAGRYDGEGMYDVPEEDLVKAVYWYRKAALQGDERAQYELALKYANGSGIAKNYVQAAHWFRKAADQGNSWAPYFLGIMYTKGDGVEKDDVQAALWLHKSVERVHPHPNAQAEIDKLAHRNILRLSDKKKIKAQ